MPPIIKVTQDNTPYSCKVSDGRSVLHADTTVDKGGAGDGFRPHDLLAAALGSCLSIWVKEICAGA